MQASLMLKTRSRSDFRLFSKNRAFRRKTERFFYDRKFRLQMMMLNRVNISPQKRLIGWRDSPIH